MTQKQILSVQNTETAIPIHHIPTFDEVYAMPYVRESLECILDQNIRQYQILYSFKDDLRQEILIHMNNERNSNLCPLNHNIRDAYSAAKILHTEKLSSLFRTGPESL